MKTTILVLSALCGFLILPGAVSAQVAPADDPVGIATESYFTTHFERLKEVAEQQPTRKTFRKAMRPLVDATPGFFGGTLVDTNYVIREVYLSRNFLARGFNLKKVKQLDYFWDLMSKNPTPQLSEPGHGSLVQPRLIAMRYPVLDEGELQAVVSLMVRTPDYLKATGLDKAKAYRITCRGTVAEEKGKLGENPSSVTVQLPENEWLIEYVK
jgi:hypothetical protein